MSNQHLHASLSLVFLAGACGNSNQMMPAGGDMAAKHDLGPVPPDMSGLTSKTYKYVSDLIILPASGSFYAADLNGDGKTENSFGNIVNVLNSQMIDLQSTEKATNMAGDGLNLFAFTSTDATLKDDTAASVNSYEAVKTVGPPNFSGTGMFTVDTAVSKATLAGVLKSGTFQSTDPLTLTDPPTAYVRIVLGDTDSVNMPIYGARIKFDPSGSSLLKGQLNGGMRKRDIDTILIPALASAMNKIATQNPCPPGSNCDKVRQSFDAPPNGNGDGMVSVDEVRSNQVVVELLKPDVQLFDMDGKWHPNPDNSTATKDSLSFGVGFTAVKAIFTEP